MSVSSSNEPCIDMQRFFLFGPNRFIPIFILLLFVILPISSASGWMTYSLDEPITVLRANSAIDIIYDGEYVWLATTKGISGTNDLGESWITYDETNGLNSGDISAIAASEGDLWVGSAHNVLVNDQQIAWGDGFNVTSDLGNIWDSYQPHQATFSNMLAYDIAVLDSVAYAGCFAGGLIRSFDKGETWTNVFADYTDSVDFVNELFEESSNYYYSVVIDTFQVDTTFIWAGSAAGVHKYAYVAENAKLAGNDVYDVAFNGDSTVWVAASGGVSRSISPNSGFAYTYRSWDEDDGMLSDYFTAIAADSDFVITAAWDTVGRSGLGFNYTTDAGETWDYSEPDQASGEENIVTEIEISNDIIFAACSEGGLIRSTDGGINWDALYLDDTETSSDDPHNRAYCLSTDQLGEDSLALWVGTDSGVVVFVFEDPTTDPVEKRHIQFVDSDTTGQHIQAIMVWDLDTTLVWDDDSVTKQIWVATWPEDEDVGTYMPLRSTDYGETWETPLETSQVFDITSWRGSVILGLTGAFLYSTDYGHESFESGYVGSGNTRIYSPFRSLEPAGYWLWVGNLQRAIRWLGPGYAWFGETVTTDPLKFDFHTLYDRDNNGLSGDFVVALGVQYDGSDKKIWAATQRTNVGAYGITYTKNNGDDWVIAATGVRVWNFAFDESDVYFAADEGLYFIEDGTADPEKIEFVENDRREIVPTAEFYAVRVVDDYLWAGSSDGIAIKELSTGDTDVFREFRSVTELEGGDPYTTPNPVSPTKGEGFVRFHYELNKATNVTIKIYDFAMNLVDIVVDNEPREPRGDGTQEDEDTWDMRNGNGDLVAAGVYFFFVETSSGDQRWGKLMVLP